MKTPTFKSGFFLYTILTYIPYPYHNASDNSSAFLQAYRSRYLLMFFSSVHLFRRTVGGPGPISVLFSVWQNLPAGPAPVRRTALQGERKRPQHIAAMPSFYVTAQLTYIVPPFDGNFDIHCPYSPKKQPAQKQPDRNRRAEVSVQKPPRKNSPSSSDGLSRVFRRDYSLPFQQYVQSLQEGIPIASIISSSLW